MKCEQAVERLDAYVDGELAEAEFQDLELHLAGCDACRAAERELRALVAEARALPREAQPERDLWPDIAIRLGRRGRVVAFGPRRRGWQPAWLGLAAAAAVLAATALTLRTPAPQPEPDAPVAQPVTSAALDPIESAEAEYVRATSDLLAQLDARRGQLPSATLTRLHENMRTIDTALDEIRNALRQAPGNPRLAQLLSATYQKKLELLRRATRVRA